MKVSDVCPGVDMLEEPSGSDDRPWWYEDKLSMAAKLLLAQVRVATGSEEGVYIADWHITVHGCYFLLSDGREIYTKTVQVEPDEQQPDHRPGR